jgi:hypothetical protein
MHYDGHHSVYAWLALASTLRTSSMDYDEREIGVIKDVLLVT